MAKSLLSLLAAALAAAALGSLAPTAGAQSRAKDAAAQLPPPVPLPEPLAVQVDYANPALWLCRPGLAQDHCKVDISASIIDAKGKAKVEKMKAAKPKDPPPPIDCFYVYPTVSLDPGYISDWTPDRMEMDVVRLQLARFGAVCRTFAPLYRQRTLTVLRASAGGPEPVGPLPPGYVGGFYDVSSAFNWYLQNENRGRGFVLIGHSQGAGLLTRLIASEIDGKPIQKQMVSAIILGSSVLVPPGQDVGGSFKSVPLCRAETQTGCVISYATFRDLNPPPEGTRFARGRDGMVAACTNPASLAGGQALADSYFLARGFLNGSGGTAQPPWASPEPRIRTPFVKVPGLVGTSCVTRGDFSYLEMKVNADPADKRADALAGEVVRATGPDLAWGLHLIDVDVAMGDLVRIVRRQTAAHLGLPAG